MADTPLVGIIVGSKSDLSVMEECAKQLDEFGVAYELVIASAHRNPGKVHEWASTAADRGIKVIIAAAGKAAHLGGVVAAFTPLPVITVPMKTSDPSHASRSTVRRTPRSSRRRFLERRLMHIERGLCSSSGI